MSKPNFIDDFREAFSVLLSTVPGLDNACPPVKIAGGKLAVADAVSRLKGRSYEILVNSGFPSLLKEATGLFVLRNSVTRISGKIEQPLRSREDLIKCLEHSIGNYLEHNEWPSSRSEIDFLVDLALRNAGETLMLIYVVLLQMSQRFVIAHELGHIVAGHCASPIPSGRHPRWELEFEADACGIELLIQSIRSSSTERVAIVTALNAVAMVLGLIDLIERAARERCLGWKNSHPPGRRRYWRIRQKCIDLDVPKEWLSDFQTVSPPDDTLCIFSYLFHDCSWQTTRDPLPDVSIHLDQLEEFDDRISIAAAVTSLGDPMRSLVELHPIRRGLERALATDREHIRLRTLLARTLMLQGGACVQMLHLDDAKMYLGMARLHCKLLADHGVLNKVDAILFASIHDAAEDAWLSREQFLSNAFIEGESEPEAAYLRALADESRAEGYKELRVQFLKEALEIYRDVEDIERQKELEVELSRTER
jgi:hypothetical protein